MPSLVELIFSAVGADETAAAAKKIQGGLSQMAQTMTGEATGAASGLTSALSNQSAVFRDKLQNAISDSTKQLLAFGAASVSVYSIYGNLRDIIGSGAEYTQLSRRTGESVRDLVVLEQAFKNAGLGANYVGTAANLLERVLSGTTASGKRTAVVFSELGISMQQMKSLNFTEQLQLLGEAFGKLPDQSTRAGAAMQLFGRYAGGQMLQLLADTDAFKRAEQQAGSFADRMSQDAGKFNQVSMQLNGMKLQIENLFAAAAEQLLPTLREISTVMGGMNTSALGVLLGTVGPVLGGGLLGVFAIDKLDMALVNAADKFKGQLIGDLAGVAGRFTGMLATVLPYGLGIAIAAEIVNGIVTAMLDARVQALVHQTRATNAEVEPWQKRMLGIGSQGDASALLGQLNARIKELEDKQSENANSLAADTSQQIMGRTAYQRSQASSAIPGETATAKILGDELTQLRALARSIADPTTIGRIIADNAGKALHESLVQLVATLPQLQAQNQKLRLQDQSPQDRLASLMGQRSGLQAQLGAALPAGLSDDEINARKLNIQNQLLEISHQIQESEKQISEQAKQQAEAAQKREIYELETQQKKAEAAGNTQLAQQLKEQIELKQAIFNLSGLDLSLAKERIAAEHQIWEQEEQQKATKDSIESTRKALQGRIDSIRGSLTDLEADYSRTDAQKWEDRKIAIGKEIAALEAQMDADKLLAQLARASNKPKEAELYDADGKGVNKELGQAKRQDGQLGPNPNNWYQNTMKDLTQLQSSMGTVAQQISHSISSLIGGAFDSLSKNITNAIVHTGDFKQAIGQIGVSIEESIVGSIISMAAKWAESLAIMAARWIATKLGLATADKALDTSSVAAAIPIATMLASIWSGPATLATIASWGGAAAAAPAEVATAMAASQILSLSAGFARGEYTGDGPESEVAGVVHRKEFVFSAPAVRSIGLAHLQAQHRAAVAGSSSSSHSNISSATGSRGGQRPQHHHHYIDHKVFMSAIRSDVEGIAHQVYLRNVRKNR